MGLARTLMAATLMSLATTCGYAAPNAYVGNLAMDNVSVIDTAENAVIANAALGGAGGSWGVAVHPSGTRAYIGWFKGVSVIEATTNSVIATIGGGEGFGLAINPEGTRLFVTDRYSVPYRVRVVDTASNSVVASIPIAFQPTGVAVSPDGRYVYVATQGGSRVWVIDATLNDYASMPSLNLCAGDFSGIGIAVSPDGSRVYVATGNALCAIDARTGIPVVRIPLSLYSGWVLQLAHASFAWRTQSGYEKPLSNYRKFYI